MGKQWCRKLLCHSLLPCFLLTCMPFQLSRSSSYLNDYLRAGETSKQLRAWVALAEVQALVPSTQTGWLTNAHNSPNHLHMPRKHIHTTHAHTERDTPTLKKKSNQIIILGVPALEGWKQENKKFKVIFNDPANLRPDKENLSLKMLSLPIYESMILLIFYILKIS